MSDIAISVDHLVVIRGNTTVLPDISVEIAAGKITGLLGPSGSGKSTLIRAIVGVQRVHSGSVSVLGSPAGSPALRSQLGYVTQAPSVYEDLTVQENLRYFSSVLGTTDSDVDRAVNEVSLVEYRSHPVSQLSGGQRARVSLATALLNSPRVLVLDEPTVGLDPVLRRDLWNTFRSLASGGVTLLISSHVMDEAERCDDLLLLRDGRVLGKGSPRSLCEQTGANDVENAFLTLVENIEEVAQ